MTSRTHQLKNRHIREKILQQNEQNRYVVLYETSIEHRGYYVDSVTGHNRHNNE